MGKNWHLTTIEFFHECGIFFHPFSSSVLDSFLVEFYLLDLHIIVIFLNLVLLNHSDTQFQSYSWLGFSYTVFQYSYLSHCIFPTSVPSFSFTTSPQPVSMADPLVFLPSRFLSLLSPYLVSLILSPFGIMVCSTGTEGLSCLFLYLLSACSSFWC